MITKISADAAFSYASANNNPLFGLEQWHGVFPDEIHWRAPISPFVVISGSSILFRNDRPIPNQPIRALQGIIDQCLVRGLDVVLMSSDDGPDDKLLMQLAIANHLCFVSAHTPTIVALEILRKSLCFVSGRWHASILSCCVGTPFILGNANFFKTEYLNDQLFPGKRIFDFLDLPAYRNHILDSVDQIRSYSGLNDSAFREYALSQKCIFRQSVKDLCEELASH